MKVLLVGLLLVVLLGMSPPQAAPPPSTIRVVGPEWWTPLMEESVDWMRQTDIFSSVAGWLDIKGGVTINHWANAPDTLVGRTYPDTREIWIGSGASTDLIVNALMITLASVFIIDWETLGDCDTVWEMARAYGITYGLLITLPSDSYEYYVARYIEDMRVNWQLLTSVVGGEVFELPFPEQVALMCRRVE